MSASRNICLVAASPITVSAFLVPHIFRLARDYRVTVVCNGVPDSPQTLPAQVRSFPIVRHISIIADIRALCMTIRKIARLTVQPRAPLRTSSAFNARITASRTLVKVVIASSHS
jgi:hypothetical protein